MEKTCGILIESGIDIGEGNIVTEGRVLEIAREAKRLNDAREYESFKELILGEEAKSLGDRRLLLGTVITETGMNILTKLAFILEDEEADELEDQVVN